MADYLKAVPNILRWEGGFANDPYDRGGATMKGITLTTFRQYYGSGKTVSDLKNITDAQWGHIFKVGYWDKLKCDSFVNQSVANLLVDFGWMSGVAVAAKAIQIIVGVKADGIIGPKSIAAINAFNQRKLFESLYNARVDFFYKICATRPANKRFLNGWLNRLKSYRYSA